jgi:hypothetical protein
MRRSAIRDHFRQRSALPGLRFAASGLRWLAPKILIVNPNTTVSMTETIAAGPNPQMTDKTYADVGAP